MSRLAELESALIKADAAGNTDDAKALAGEIRRIRSAGSQQDTQTAKPLSPSMQKAQDSVARRKADEEQRLSELSPEQRALISDMSPVDAFRVGIGRGFATIGRGIGLVDPEDEATQAGIEALKAKSPIATGAGEIIGETAPFLLPGAAIGKIPSAAGRVATTAGLGATEGALITKGLGGDTDDQIQAGGISGVAAGTMELALPHIGRIGGAFIRRAFGKEPAGAIIDSAGNPSKELLEALKKEGVEYSDLVDQAASLSKTADPDQAARKAILESEGLTPTKAQITRDAADFQAQQEAAKTSGRVRDAIEDQDRALTTRFQSAVVGTGGEAGQPTNTVFDALTSKATDLDSKVGSLYKRAREQAAGAQNVDFSLLARKLSDSIGSDTKAGGNVTAVIGEMKRLGLVDDDLNVTGKATVEASEDLRAFINTLYDPQNGFGNLLGRQMKDALDDDVFRASGKDIFNQARTAKREFEQELARSGLSKFDSRKQNLVRDILENKINPDTFINDVVRSKRWRPEDIQQLKSYVGTTEAGKQALMDMKADVMDDIFSRSFIGPEDAQGFQALSRDKLEKAINGIGDKKLSVIFDTGEVKFLKKMMAVAKIREPVRGTQQGLGPSAQAVGGVEKLIRDIPLVGAAYDMTIDASGRLALKSKPARQAVTIEGSPAATAAALGLGASASAAAQNEEQ